MYGEEDVDPENGDAVMSDKITYSFDDMLSQVQVYRRGLLPECANAVLNKVVLWVCVLSLCLSVCLPACLSVCPLVCLSVCLSVYLSTYLFVCLSVIMAVIMVVIMSVCFAGQVCT